LFSGDGKTSASLIGKVTSIYSLIDTANQINKSDLSMFELSVLYNEIPNDYKTDLIDPYLNIENNMIKISTRVKDSKNIKRNDLINDINSFLLNEFDNLEEFKVNGLLVLYNNMLKSLFSSQIKSLGFVILAIFIMFVILFRSLKLSIIGIIPNIFASTFILGLIGLLKIPLDIMTITIAAISPGIIAFILYSKIQKYLGASITGFTLYLFVVYGAFYGIFFFNEELFASHYLGGALVLLGVYFAKKT